MTEPDEAYVANVSGFIGHGVILLLKDIMLAHRDKGAVSSPTMKVAEPDKASMRPMIERPTRAAC